MPTKKRLITKPNRKTEIAAEQESSIRSYLKLPYSRILIPEEDGRFSAEVLEFSGCIAQGNSAGEAFANLEEAAKSWIAACLREGKEIPPPSVNYGYSGKFLLRLPRDLHRLASRKAERDAVSLNQCIVTSVAAWVGADNLAELLMNKLQVNFMQANFYSVQPIDGPDFNIDKITRWELEPKRVTPDA